MDIQNAEISGLMQQMKKLEAECAKIEKMTQANYAECDKYEKKLTKLTFKNSELQKEADQLNTNEKTQLQTAL